MAQEGACPPKDDDALQELKSYLGDEAWKEARQEAGISVPASEIRVLTDSQDAEICRKLSSQYRDKTQDRFFSRQGPTTLSSIKRGRIVDIPFRHQFLY